MISFFQQVICPFCFNAFALKDLKFRCIVPKCPGRGPDPVYANARGYDVTVMGRELVSRKHLSGPSETVVCPSCKKASQTRICPVCHFEFPVEIGRIDQHLIGIIGSPAASKAHYMTSLITCLEHEVGKNFELTVRRLDDNTRDRWNREFYTPLFVDKMALRPGQKEPPNLVPLIFRLTLGSGANMHALDISFFDCADEDVTLWTTTSVQNRYISCADGIIFLLDPLQIQGLCQQLLSTDIPRVDPKTSPVDAVIHLRSILERHNSPHPGQQIGIPVAFTLSNIDILFPLLSEGSTLLWPGEHFGYVDLDEVQSIHTEVSHFLKKWISPEFCEIIHDGFACYHYFGVSSLGEQPVANNHLTSVSPLRVEDPFLWLLYQLDLVKGKKGRVM